MPVREQRAARHDRLVLRVTIDAGTARVGGCGVLVLVARRADFGGRFAVGCVGGRNILVTVAARSALGGLVFVRAMTAQAILRAVDFDRRQLPLLLRVAALAIAGTERSEERWLATASAQAAAAAAGAGLLQRGQRRFVAATLERKSVTAGAVGLEVPSEARARFARCVLDLRLFFVAHGAAVRRHFADLALLEAVTAAALDALFEHVSAMASHRARNLPGLLNVDARLGLVTASRNHRCHQHGREQPNERGATPPMHTEMLLPKLAGRANRDGRIACCDAHVSPGKRRPA